MIESGTTIKGRYDVVGRVGGGTFGDVFKARVRKTGQIVAIKAQRGRTLDSTTQFGHLAEKLSNDLENARQLEGIHGVPTVYDDGWHEGRRFFIMEYIDGSPLSRLADSVRPVRAQFAATVMAQLCAVVEQVHARGLLHCDIKPENIVVRQDGSVWLLDFGSALPVNENVSVPYATPGYVPPEHFTDEPPTVQWDVYALGATLLEMCVMYVPYAKHDGRPSRDTPQFHGIPLHNMDKRLRDLALRMVAFDAGQRPDVAEVRAALAPMLPREGDRRDPWAPHPDPAEWYRYGRHLRHRAS